MWGQVVTKPNTMFIVYFSGCVVTMYNDGSTWWGQVVRKFNMFIVYFSSENTVKTS